MQADKEMIDLTDKQAVLVITEEGRRALRQFLEDEGFAEARAIIGHVLGIDGYGVWFATPSDGRFVKLLVRWQFIITIHWDVDGVSEEEMRRRIGF